MSLDGVLFYAHEFWVQLLVVFTDIVVPLGWQILIFVILIHFSRPIIGLLERLKKAHKDGFEFSSQPVEGAAGRGGDVLPISGLEKNGDSTLNVWFDRISENIANNPVSNKEEALIDALAVSSRAEMGQFLLRHIFGTQIEFLYYLDMHKSVNKSESLKYFNKHSEIANGELAKSFEDWLAFLINSELISISNSDIEITKVGSSIVKYFKSIKIESNMFRF